MHSEREILGISKRNANDIHFTYIYIPKASEENFSNHNSRRSGKMITM